MNNITVTWRCKNCGNVNDSRSYECESCGSNHDAINGARLRSLINTANINTHTGPNQGVIFNQPQIIVNPPPLPIEIPEPKEPSHVWRGFKSVMFWALIGSAIGALVSLGIKTDNGAEQFMQIFVWALFGAGIGSTLGFIFLQIAEIWRANKAIGILALACFLITAIPTTAWFMTSPTIQEHVIDRGPLATVFVAYMLLSAYCFVSYIALLIFGVIAHVRN
jgi:hypothetical protein